MTLFAAGLLILVRTFLRWPVRPLDEGILLTGAMLVHDGKAPYLDFYSNYPPGIFLSIAGLWKVFGVSLMATRYLGLVVQAGLAIAAGRLAGQAVGRRFSWIGAGLTIAWLCPLKAIPYAWLAGLFAALVFAERLRAAAGSSARGPWLAAGLALGALGCLRHDLFAYFGLALAALGVAWAVRTRRWRPPGEILRAGAWGLGVAGAVLGLVWIPTLARAGVRVVSADLFFDQVRYVMPSRVLPLPDLMWKPPGSPGPGFPAFFGQPFEGAVALTLAAPLLGALAFLLVRRLEGRPDLGLLLTTALAVAVLPQLLGRADLEHALYTVTPALVVGAAVVEWTAARARRPLHLAAGYALVAALVLPIAPTVRHVLGQRPPSGPAGPSVRYDGIPEATEARAAARREVFAFLDEHTRPGDPIFVGCVDHRFPFHSEVDLYFLADRTGATRYMQFDPGLIQRREVQEQMVRELETVRPAAAVLSPHFNPAEPNESAKAGATVLDEYLRTRYRTVRSTGSYRLLLRR